MPRYFASCLRAARPAPVRRPAQARVGRRYPPLLRAALSITLCWAAASAPGAAAGTGRIDELERRAVSPLCLRGVAGSEPVLLIEWADGVRTAGTAAGSVAGPVAAAVCAPTPPGAIPHSRPGAGTGIRSATLVDPTGRYAHGVLGDSIEASGVRVETRSGDVLSLDLGPESVFEDLDPRLHDLDGDGLEEVIVVRSYLDRGAALSVLGAAGGRLAVIAETPPIGRSHRWLNPVGAADFDGDGRVEIAYVETPHIGGILRIWELTPDGLVEEGAQRGYSNHAMGSTALGLSRPLDSDGDGVPEILVPGRDRRSLVVVSFAGGAFVERTRYALEAPIVTALEVFDLDADGRDDVFFGTADGRVHRLRF